MARAVTNREIHEEFQTSEGARQHETQPTSPGQRARLVLLVSVLGSAAAAAAIGGVCALLYPIIGELRGERVRREDGTVERMLGFWSILVLSLVAFMVCSVFSWTLTFLNSYKPTGFAFTTLPLPHSRGVSGYDIYWSYGVAAFNGVMAAIAVIWTLC